MQRALYQPYTNSAASDKKEARPSAPAWRSTVDRHVSLSRLPVFFDQLVAVGYQNEVGAKLSLDWAVNNAYWVTEHHRVELRHHLPLAKAPQVATLFGARARRVLTSGLLKGRDQLL
eukprot:FR743019.1.p1 GENE.FR743019.1~~FR743019.1.p1  ORF type:complete len:117 (-),score=5.12 FR743019.1:52-402(-)